MCCIDHRGFRWLRKTLRFRPRLRLQFLQPPPPSTQALDIFASQTFIICSLRPFQINRQNGSVFRRNQGTILRVLCCALAANYFFLTRSASPRLSMFLESLFTSEPAMMIDDKSFPKLTCFFSSQRISTFDPLPWYGFSNPGYEILRSRDINRTGQATPTASPGRLFSSTYSDPSCRLIPPLTQRTGCSPRWHKQVDEVHGESIMNTIFSRPRTYLALQSQFSHSTGTGFG
jgi:hypothetical protein